MFSLVFWKLAAERAIKSAAQAAIVVFGTAEVTDAFTFNWKAAAGAAGAGAVLSVLTSVASAPFGPDDEPSVV